jgi:hypothetical protein
MRIDAALIQARSRQETFSELNRLLRKRFPGLPQQYFTQENSDVRLEWLTAKQLAQFNPGHTRTNPHQMTGALVACEYRGQTYMLDGTNRLNVWLRDGDRALHETIILKNRESNAA